MTEKVINEGVDMKTLIRLEETAFFILSIFLFAGLDYPWWLFPVLLFVPDIGMLGYIVDTRAGAVVYNIVHHRALAVSTYIIGMMLGVNILALVGIILFAHSSLDRVFNYGFKYKDAFGHTHLNG